MYMIVGYDQQPLSTAAYLNDYARFFCYVREGMPPLFWFVNSTFVSALPARFNASSQPGSSQDGIGANSTLRILALEETNNSLIRCGVRVHDPATPGRINLSYFPAPAQLLVQGYIQCHSVMPHPAITHNDMQTLVKLSINLYFFCINMVIIVKFQEFHLHQSI